MDKTIFHISRMDCPSEERIIRMKLEGLPSVKKLEFDIPGRTMAAYHTGDATEIFSLLEPLNFGASLRSTEKSSDFTLAAEDQSAEGRVLKILFAINAVMFLAELSFGIYAESMGLISDSLDMFADASVYLISLYAVGKAIELKKRSARVNGILQLIMGTGLLVETLRRFIYGSDPEPTYMIFVSLAALAANVYCLYLLSGHRERGVHMKASYICSSTDVIANTGVVVAGLLVILTHSRIPDLVIGVLVVMVVMRGARSILRLAD